MDSGRKRLRDWLDRSKLNQREAAKILRVPEPMLSQWLSGTRRPGLDNVVNIFEVTGVPVDSWARKRLRDTDPAEMADSRNV